jgi:hypothetical protein
MDIFVRGLPEQATTKQVKKFFTQPLAEAGIDENFYVSLYPILSPKTD